jgi:hypothetical protein
MNATWMLYNTPAGPLTYGAYDFVHGTTPVTLASPSGVAMVSQIPRLSVTGGIVWQGLSMADVSPYVAYASSLSSPPSAWVPLPATSKVSGSDATSVRFVSATATGLSFCSLPLSDLTSTPHCVTVASQETPASGLSARDYGSWSMITLHSALYVWAGDTVSPVSLPTPPSVSYTSIGDIAYAVLIGSSASSVVRINPNGTLGTAPSWPTKPVPLTGLALAPDRVVAADERDGGQNSNSVAWSKSVSSSGFGPEAVLPRKAYIVAATAGRTFTTGLDGVSAYDRGKLGATISQTHAPLEASGPYIFAGGFDPNLWSANGDVLGTSQGFTTLFGSQSLLYWQTGPAGAQSLHITLTDLTGSAPTRSFEVRASGTCEQLYVWGDLATPDCDGVVRVINLKTGKVVASTAGPLTPVGIGDGYVIIFDHTTQTYELWRTSDNTMTTLTDCLSTVNPATDGVGHVVCASATELIWRDFSYMSTSAGRVLGWLAPSSFSSGTWTPQIDVTKAFTAGVLRIRQGSTLVREIPVPASADGSVRGVSWDGKTSGGTVAPTGIYTAELIASGTDGSGVVKAVDGVSAPTFDLAWTGPGLTKGLPGSFVALSPSRLLDTRVSSGGSGPVSAYGSVDLQVTGRGGVPSSGVDAVILNVTVVTPQASGYATVYPTGTAAPNASNLNFTPGQVVPNLVVAKLGTGGKVTIRNGSPGRAEVVADVAGYFVGGTAVDPGGLTAVAPSRLLDTRPEMGGTGAVTPFGSTRVQVTGRGGVPGSGVSAAVVNLTAVAPTFPGFLTAFPTGGSVPTASNVNFVAGQVVPNLAVVKLDADGSFTLRNGSAGWTHEVVDVVGYVMDGLVTGSGMYVPVNPSRILETRPEYGGTGAVAPFGVKTLAVTGVGGVPATGVSGVVMNVTVVAGGAPGYLTVYPADVAAPLASNLNFTPGLTVPNLVAVKTSAAGAVNILNASTSAIQVIADVSGYFTA